MTEIPTLVTPGGAALTSELPPERDWLKAVFPIQLFNDRIVLQRADRADKSVHGLPIPEDSRTRPTT